jgi:phosphohistidine phosphatase SixA
MGHVAVPIAMTSRFITVFILLAGLALPLQARDSTPLNATDAALLQEMRSGAVVLMRHTQTTPGVGDPPGWRLQDCTSQRNLDSAGIAHAQRIGRWFAQHKLKVSAVRNSPWCRTRDTAKLAFGRSDDWQALANIFEDRSAAEVQTTAAQQALQAVKPGELVVWVSHGITISQLLGNALGHSLGHSLGDAGVALGVGEAVVVRRGKSEGAPVIVLGRLLVP